MNERIIDLLQSSKAGYTDIKRVTFAASPAGNWCVYYNGEYTGIIIDGNIITDSYILENGMEEHNA